MQCQQADFPHYRGLRRESFFGEGLVSPLVEPKQIKVHLNPRTKIEYLAAYQFLAAFVLFFYFSLADPASSTLVLG